MVIFVMDLMKKSCTLMDYGEESDVICRGRRG
jgi:hypothetical protein